MFCSVERKAKLHPTSSTSIIKRSTGSDVFMPWPCRSQCFSSLDHHGLKLSHYSSGSFHMLVSFRVSFFVITNSRLKQWFSNQSVVSSDPHERFRCIVLSFAQKAGFHLAPRSFQSSSSFLCLLWLFFSFFSSISFKQTATNLWSVLATTTHQILFFEHIAPSNCRRMILFQPTKNYHKRQSTVMRFVVVQPWKTMMRTSSVSVKLFSTTRLK